MTKNLILLRDARKWLLSLKHTPPEIGEFYQNHWQKAMPGAWAACPSGGPRHSSVR
jgi:hypothetical protein